MSSSGSIRSRGSFLIRSFSISDTPDNRKLLKEAKMMADKDWDSFSELVVASLREYIKRHSPGNPQLILQHWTEDMPMPESTRSSHIHQWQHIRKREIAGDDVWACTDMNCTELWYQ